MKRQVLLLVVIATLLLTPVVVSAAYQQPIHIMIDGERVISEINPIVENARVLVPVRSVAESLGFSVFWDSAKRDVYLSKTSTAIKFNINSSMLWKNGSARDIDVAPQIYKGHTYLPVRSMSESIGANIVWDGSTKSVIIQTKSIMGNHSEEELPMEITGISEAAHPYKVVIDAGHGGHDSGAVGYSGYREKDLNLAIAKKVVALLDKEPEIEGIFTRKGDYFISLNHRVNFANQINADLFISIHANAMPGGKSYIGGSQSYYTRNNSLAFARVMHSYLLKGTQFSDKGIHREGFRVIKYTNMPAVLLELGYMTNYNEEKTMVTSGTFQRRTASEIVDGIKDFLNVK